LLPSTRESVHGHDLRNSKNRTSFLCRTNRYKSRFFPSLIDRLIKLKTDTIGNILMYVHVQQFFNNFRFLDTD
jgi:hypothetical protein